MFGKKYETDMGIYHTENRMANIWLRSRDHIRFLTYKMREYDP